METTVDVIIPTYKPDRKFNMLLDRLQRQTVLPRRILVINTEEKFWRGADVAHRIFNRGWTDNGITLSVRHIREQEFDHGGTRALAASMCTADVLLFMTQDAVPADERLIEQLLYAMEDADAAAAYARQLPAADCGVLERYARGFNYGGKSRVKSAKDLPRLGIKTYFCSNVCAAYRRLVYEKLGGFETRTIFNEDMIFAAKLIKNGYRIAYAADARVIHSHNYSGVQQFSRNFDLAVSQADHPEVFAEVPSEKEGRRLVKKTAGFLLSSGKFYLLPALLWQSGCKYLGYSFGRRYQKLPKGLVKRCSMNKNYWKNKLF